MRTPLFAPVVFVLIGILAVLALGKVRAVPSVENVFEESDRERQVVLLRRLLEKRGAGPVQQEIFQKAPDNLGNIHVVVHLIGEWLYETRGGIGVLSCSDDLLLACHHGFMGMLVADKGIAGLEDLLDALGKRDLSGNQKIQLAHGAGHAIANHLHYDVLAAVKTCDAIQDSFQTPSPYWCYFGVFMENAVSHAYSGVPRAARLDKDSDPLLPCKDMESRYRWACYTIQPRLLGWFFDHDRAKVAEACASLPDARDKNACFEGIARLVVINSSPSNRSLQDVYSTCGTLPGGYPEQCMIFSAISYVWLGDFSEFPIAICSGLTEQDQRICGRYLALGLAIMRPEQEVAENFCRSMPDTMRDERCERVFQKEPLDPPSDLDNVTNFQRDGFSVI